MPEAPSGATARTPGVPPQFPARPGKAQPHATDVATDVNKKAVPRQERREPRKTEDVVRYMYTKEQKLSATNH